jgi:hypothetical protein
MPALIQRLPFGPARSELQLTVPLGNPVPLLTDQIVLWVSVAPLGDELPPDSPRFPAILDTGFNNGFLLQKSQLIGWASPGVYEHCDRSGVILRSAGELIPLYYASVWVYPNIPGSRDPRPNGTPFYLDIPGGIALTPSGSRVTKSLPLIGTAAIRHSNLRVQIDGGRETVDIQVP